MSVPALLEVLFDLLEKEHWKAARDIFPIVRRHIEKEFEPKDGAGAETLPEEAPLANDPE